MLKEGWHLVGYQCLLVNDDSEYPLWSTSSGRTQTSSFYVDLIGKVEGELGWCHMDTTLFISSTKSNTWKKDCLVTNYQVAFCVN